MNRTKQQMALAWYRLCYTAWAPIYDLLVRMYRRARRRSIRLLDAKAGERVLIVGAGTGLDLEHLGSGRAVTAIDLTPAMLDRLGRRARRLGLAVDARVMDSGAMDFPDGSFDAAVLHLILAVTPDPRACAAEVARVLRPGGRAVILDKFIPDDARPPLLLRLLNPALRLFGTDILRRLGPILAGTGLRVVHQQPAALGGLLKIILLRKD